tara:strand:+ start:2375 stop:2623 length:249 start_codon:yes stop_codon:yes gene_type:complete
MTKYLLILLLFGCAETVVPEPIEPDPIDCHCGTIVSESGIWASNGIRMKYIYTIENYCTNARKTITQSSENRGDEMCLDYQW